MLIPGSDLPGLGCFTLNFDILSAHSTGLRSSDVSAWGHKLFLLSQHFSLFISLKIVLTPLLQNSFLQPEFSASEALGFASQIKSSLLHWQGNIHAYILENVLDLLCSH